MIGDALNLPVLKAVSSFTGIAVIDSDPYTNTGTNWYTNTNNFFRSVRNFVIDLTALPQGSGAGIHWQVAQASSLQNIRFEMVRGGGTANKQQGIFMDNGSGGFMTDLVFNGGGIGMFLGNQQFTTRNLTFNDCNTAIFMNWNWLWTFKSITVNNCGVALNMSNSPSNQTVGSVLVLDSTISTSGNAIITAFSNDSVPAGAGTLVLDNVDFTNSKVAVAGIDGGTILPGGSVVPSWVQGNSYTPSGGPQKRSFALDDLQPRQGDSCPAPQVHTVTVNPGTGIPSSAASSIIYLPSPTTAPALAASSGVPPSSGVASSSGVLPYSGALPSAGVPPSSTGGATCSNTRGSKARVQGPAASQAKPGVLLDSSGKIFERSKPQYESYPASSFVSIKSAGAKGDGTADDTAAIQEALDSITSDQILYVDHGAYIITSTLKIPKDIKIVGEIWPLFMASGHGFGDEKNPIPMFQVGQPGDKGTVEISDIILETKGPAPGAILMEWNVAESAQGSAGFWDVHFRIGGSAGTDLQSDRCAKDPTVSHTNPNPQCIGAFLLFHVTQNASVYVENSWFWVADHELDLSDHSQIDIYNGRGVLIESQGPVWLWGTSSEHSQLYNYQISNARNVFMALIQTETP
jgi:glucan 1,3-beta-glucosidase